MAVTTTATVTSLAAQKRRASSRATATSSAAVARVKKPAQKQKLATTAAAAAAASPPPPRPSRDLTKVAIPASPAEMAPQLAQIAQSGRTEFEKKVWTLLCQIPAGRVSTYGLMSAHLGSSPRAVGNALRRNPFAPQVPCHRVVATGGALGGFKGQWPRDGEGITIDEKRSLLRGEGVRIDDKGRVLGTPWSGFN